MRLRQPDKDAALRRRQMHTPRRGQIDRSQNLTQDRRRPAGFRRFFCRPQRRNVVRRVDHHNPARIDPDPFEPRSIRPSEIQSAPGLRDPNRRPRPPSARHRRQSAQKSHRRRPVAIAPRPYFMQAGPLRRRLGQGVQPNGLRARRASCLQRYSMNLVAQGRDLRQLTHSWGVIIPRIPHFDPFMYAICSKTEPRSPI